MAFSQSTLDPPPFIWQISAAISDHAFIRDRTVFQRIFEITDQNFGDQPAVGKNDGGNFPLQKRGGNVGRFVYIRFSDAKFFVNDWRIVEKQMLFTFSSAALRNQFKGHTSETLCKILRIFY